MKKFIILILFSISFFFPACNDENATELKLVVSCTDGTFTGTIWVDGGTATDLTGTQINSNTYVYEGIFENVDTLILNVTKSVGAASLYVYIYLENDLVHNSSLLANYPDATNPNLQLEVVYQGTTAETTTSE